MRAIEERVRARIAVLALQAPVVDAETVLPAHLADLLQPQWAADVDG